MARTILKILVVGSLTLSGALSFAKTEAPVSAATTLPTVDQIGESDPAPVVLPAPMVVSPVAESPPVRLQAEDRILSREARALKNGTVMLGVTTLSLLVPLKAAVNAGWKLSPQWNAELIYLTGSLSAGIAGQDLAKFNENSVQIGARYFSDWNSFNLLMGFARDSGNARLGSDLLQGVTGYGSFDVIEFQSMGVVLGLGNRWQWSNGFTAGVDWFSVSIPLNVTKSQSFYFQSSASAADKKKAKDTLDTVAKIPRIALVNAYLGWSF